MRTPQDMRRQLGNGGDQRLSRRALFGVGASLALAAPTLARDSAAAEQTRRDRATAIRSIPFARLKQQTQRKIEGVVNSPTIFRSMPVQVVDCHPQLYLCLVRNPELVVNIWSLMGITNVKLTRQGPFEFTADDGAGTVSSLELVYGTPKIHIVYANGFYEGPLLGRRLKGACVMVLHSGYSQSSDKRHFVTNQLEVFLRLDNVGADLIARTLHPIVGKTADHNFAESTQFLGQVNYAARTRPEKIHRLIERLDKVDAAVLAKFSKVTELAFADAKRNGPAVASGSAKPGLVVPSTAQDDNGATSR